MEESRLLQILFCDFLYLFAFLALYKTVHGVRVGNRAIRIGVIILLLICLFSFVGNDYWHYLEWYSDNHGSDYSTRFWEPVYVFLAKYSPTYFIFRVIVWGGAAFLALLTLRLSKVDFALALFFFLIRNFIYFSYARASLSMAMMFCGLALFAKFWEKGYLWSFVGALLIVVSLNFHKSSIFGVSIILISILLLRQNRFTIIVSFILFPVLIYLFSSVVESFLSMDLSDYELGWDKAQYYGNFGVISRTNSLSQTVIDTLWRFPFYIALAIYFLLVIHRKFERLPVVIKLFANSTALITIVAFLFLVVPNLLNFTLYYRFINYAMIPSIIFITYCFKHNLYTKLTRAFYYISLVSTSLRLLYITLITV